MTIPKDYTCLPKHLCPHPIEIFSKVIDPTIIFELWLPEIEVSVIESGLLTEVTQIRTKNHLIELHGCEALVRLRNAIDEAIKTMAVEPHAPCTRQKEFHENYAIS